MPDNKILSNRQLNARLFHQVSVIVGREEERMLSMVHMIKDPTAATLARLVPHIMFREKISKTRALDLLQQWSTLSREDIATRIAYMRKAELEKIDI